MEALKSYLLTAMLASLAASLLIRISDPRQRNYIRYIAGLTLLLLLAAPLTSLAGELAEGLEESDQSPESDHEADDKEAFIGEMGRTMSREIGDLVATRFALPRESVSVKLTLDLTDLSAIAIYRIDVTVRAECDRAAIERYLSESLNCEVSVLQTNTGEEEFP